MRTSRTSARWSATLAAGLVAGFVAVQAKGKAEGVLQPAAEKLWPPSTDEKLLPGADPAEHPENMPPAVIVTRLYRKVTGKAPGDDLRDRGAAIVHWGLGLSFAGGYALLRHRVPAAGVAMGAPAGVALYALTHATTVPALRLQPLPTRMPVAAVGWEAGSHVIYGITLEMGLRVLTTMARHLR